MGNISDTLQILQRVMEYKMASRDILKSAVKYAPQEQRDVLKGFLDEQVQSLRRIPLVFEKLRFDAPPSTTNDSITEMMDGVFVEAASGAAGETLDFRRAALRVEEKAIQILRRPLEEYDLPPELRTVLEQSLLVAEIHTRQLRKMLDD